MGGWVSQNTHICVKHNGDEKPEKKRAPFLRACIFIYIVY